MLYSFPPDLRKLIELRLDSGRYSTEDEVLRDALRALAEEDEDLVAVREAVAEWRAGDVGTPLAEAFEQVRRTHDTKGQGQAYLN
jgi:putative addiction module CopG family antidote